MGLRRGALDALAGRAVQGGGARGSEETGGMLARVSTGTPPTVLVLTPVKDAADCLDRYFAGLERLAHPASRLGLGFLESDSVDGTYDALRQRLPALRARYRRVSLAKHDYGFRIPPHVPRWAPGIQVSFPARLRRPPGPGENDRAPGRRAGARICGVVR